MATVLVIDDDAAMCRTLARVLRGEEHDVAVANSVQDAEAKLQAGCFDLLLVDLHLPDEGGSRRILDGLSRLTDRPRAIVISADGEFAARVAGARGLRFLTKPFAIEVLAMEVRAALLGHHSS
jgi:DNA-binding response OmpR family regulator